MNSPKYGHQETIPSLRECARAPEELLGFLALEYIFWSESWSTTGYSPKDCLQLALQAIVRASTTNYVSLALSTTDKVDVVNDLASYPVWLHCRSSELEAISQSFVQ